MIIIPNRQTKLLTQINNGNVFGDLWSSFNLNLTLNRGRIRNTRLLLNTNSTGNTDLGLSVGFKYYASKWWTVAGSKVSNSNNTQSSFSVDGTASSPSTCSSDTADIETFNGNLYVTSQTGLNKYTGSAWSTNAQAINTLTPHLMCVYGDRLYLTDLFSKIYSIDTSDVMATSSTYTLSFVNSLENVITFIRPSSNRIWIGVVNTLGGKGYVYEWDGVSTQVTRAYRLESQGALSCVIKDDVPYITDSNARVLKWNGGTFTEVAKFPVANKLLTKANISTVNDRFIHPNGMSLVDGKINLLVNNLIGDSGGTINENFPAGIWELDDQIGLYHKYSPSYTQVSTITDHGQNRVSRVGALVNAKITNSVASANGQLLAGITYYTDASSTLYGIFIDDTNDTVQKYGYLVTEWISSANLKDEWGNLYLRYRKFLDSSDKIISKYRLTEATAQEISITWDNTTNVFKTSTDLTNYVGYEVEILQGQGGGKTAHITTVTNYSSTYFITLDETFTGVTLGSTAKARIQNWKKIGAVTGQTTESWSKLIAKSSERIQLKICMQFTGPDELYETVLVNSSKEPFA